MKKDVKHLSPIHVLNVNPQTGAVLGKNIENKKLVPYNLKNSANLPFRVLGNNVQL